MCCTAVDDTTWSVMSNQISFRHVPKPSALWVARDIVLNGTMSFYCQSLVAGTTQENAVRIKFFRRHVARM